jgi:hypothetical protein
MDKQQRFTRTKAVGLTIIMLASFGAVGTSLYNGSPQWQSLFHLAIAWWCTLLTLTVLYMGRRPIRRYFSTIKRLKQTSAKNSVHRMVIMRRRYAFVMLVLCAVFGRSYITLLTAGTEYEYLAIAGATNMIIGFIVLGFTHHGAREYNSNATSESEPISIMA